MAARLRVALSDGQRVEIERRSRGPRRGNAHAVSDDSVGGPWQARPADRLDDAAQRGHCTPRTRSFLARGFAAVNCPVIDGGSYPCEDKEPMASPKSPFRRYPLEMRKGWSGRDGSHLAAPRSEPDVRN